MRVAFRVDASLEIGAGHVMRCLTLADGLALEGMESIFICREHIGNLIETIRQKGFKTYGLPLINESENRNKVPYISLYESWLGADWATDAQQTRMLLIGNPVDWLIADHYGVDSRWENVTKKAYQRLMVIDDLANRPHDCDILLDQNLGRQSINYAKLIQQNCRLLIGPQFALLRPEFALLRSYSFNRRAEPKLKRLLVSMGGVDKDNITALVLAALKKSYLAKDCHITVVIGKNAPWLENLKILASSMPWQTEIQTNVSNIAQLMADSDLAVGAAGTTAWERCCLGLPTLALILADNQASGARALNESGCVLLLEDLNKIVFTLPRYIELLQNCDTLRDMQRACKSITDGEGLSRTIAALKHSHE